MSERLRCDVVVVGTGAAGLSGLGGSGVGSASAGFSSRTQTGRSSSPRLTARGILHWTQARRITAPGLPTRESRLARCFWPQSGQKKAGGFLESVIARHGTRVNATPPAASVRASPLECPLGIER